LLPVSRCRRLAALPSDDGAAVHAEAARQVGVVGEGDFRDVVALLDLRLIRTNASGHIRNNIVAPWLSQGSDAPPPSRSPSMAAFLASAVPSPPSAALSPPFV